VPEEESKRNEVKVREGKSESLVFRSIKKDRSDERENGFAGVRKRLRKIHEASAKDDWRRRGGVWAIKKIHAKEFSLRMVGEKRRY